MSYNGFSSVLWITNTPIVKGSTGQPSMASGNPLEMTVTLRLVAAKMLLEQKRLLFSTKAVFPVVKGPTGLFMNIMLLPPVKARLVCFLTRNFNIVWKLSVLNFFAKLHGVINVAKFTWQDKDLLLLGIV